MKSFLKESELKTLGFSPGLQLFLSSSCLIKYQTHLTSPVINHESSTLASRLLVNLRFQTHQLGKFTIRDFHG